MSVDSHTKTIPKLRFPEFSGEWEEKKLGDITKWSSGGTPPKDIKKYWNGDIPWISASSMQGSVYFESNRTLTEEGLNKGSKLVKRGSILILVRGSMLFNTVPVGITTKDVAFNQDVKAITGNGIVNKYLLYFFQASKHKLLSKVVGTGIGAGKLDMHDLLMMSISIPAKQEQQKIADFLTAVDDKISALQDKKTRLEKYKKGIMQQIFSQQIRFKPAQRSLGEVGDKNGNNYPDWEEKSFGSVYSFLRTNSLSRADMLDSGNIKNIHYGDIHTRLATNFDSSKEPIGFAPTGYESDFCKEGDLIIADASEDRKDIGKAIEIIKINGDKIISGLHTFLARPQPNSVGVGYSGYLMQTQLIRKQLMRIATGASVLGISKTELSKVVFPLPVNEEQQKIADFLTAIDDKMNLTKRALEQTEQFKKALLQQMFV